MTNRNTDSFEEAVAFLNSRPSTAAIHELEQGVEDVLSKITGTPRASIQSAVLLTPEERTRVETFLSTLFSVRIKATYRVNESLIGGIKIQVGDWKFDASLSGKLDDMVETLTGEYA
ncbi:MAG: F0F1 ATP synthase subunit delta [bacterium]|nr:F0F1 ATP synthase subunit delta [bacterium]